MVKLVIITCISFIVLSVSSGCTDFDEPNQLAFVIGTAIDCADNGEMEISQQIVITSQTPSKGGSFSGSNNYIILSAKGKDIFEAQQKIQRETSRRLMMNHRILIAISEEFFNKNDVRKIFDKLGRDPANSLRDIIVLIKGSSAKQFLKMKHPMEPLSSIGEDKKLHTNAIRSFSSRTLIIESLTDGIRSMLPVIQIKQPKNNSKIMNTNMIVSKYAVLDKQLKVRGILDDVEGGRAGWMSGNETVQGVTIPWKDGKSYLSFRLTHLKRRVHATSVDGADKKQVVMSVKAQAYLLENTTPLNLSDVNNVIVIQNYMDEQLEKELQQTMDKVQSWGEDIFGIGEFLHRKYPYWWKSHKTEWEQHFKDIDVKVKVNIDFKSIGMIGKL
ncbi:Ger(x)C family spore germination protein [Paenibacillus albus]|uniref:Ger(X)C family spore germination protein n=1 Tax=Paenibacillus albus TaxID=2495582 RepID=A0A3Q8X7F1_9BACL|nr:Ger(x)C family spore germination protein [Paenibacillus albus]AZN41391.1 Ger(x)C family spore germination protein [Paenibacillus albus]